MKKKIVIANWKLNPETPREAKELFSKIKASVKNLRQTVVVVAPPAVFLNLLDVGKSRLLALAGQDGFTENVGAYTGQVGMSSLKYSGATYVILGHSERRSAGDTNEIINQKVKLAFKTGLSVVLCVGESIRDAHGEYLEIIKDQVKSALSRVDKKDFKKIMIAYEPVWAIGKDAKTADTPDNFLHNALFIKKILSQMVEKKVAFSIPILYGGSVDSSNVVGFLSQGEADGVLVGRSSLSSDEFKKILQVSDQIK